jgi:hypothetical protein
MSAFNAITAAMSINIKNKEAERLLAEIRQATGKGTSQIVLDLLRAEREKLEADRRHGLAGALKSTRRLQEAWAQAEIVDPRPVDEILAYDEHGLPK